MRLRVLRSLCATVWMRICFFTGVYVCVLPPWRRLLAPAILRRGRCHFSQWQPLAHAGWPRVSRLIVSGQSRSSSSSSFFVFTATDHRPRSPQEPRQRKGLGRGSVCFRQTEEAHTPSWARKRPRQRDRHAKTKFNWFTAYMDQAFAHLFRSMSWFNQRAL